MDVVPNTLAFSMGYGKFHGCHGLITSMDFPHPLTFSMRYLYDKFHAMTFAMGCAMTKSMGLKIGFYNLGRICCVLLYS